MTTDAANPSTVSHSAKERDESIRAYRDYVRELIGDATRVRRRLWDRFAIVCV